MCASLVPTLRRLIFCMHNSHLLSATCHDTVRSADSSICHLERIGILNDFPHAIRYDAAVGIDPTMITCGVEYLILGDDPSYVYDTFSNTFEDITNEAYTGCLNPNIVLRAPALYATSVSSNTQNVQSLNVIHICKATLDVMVHDPSLMTISAQIEDLEKWLRGGRHSSMDSWRWLDHYLLHEMAHSPLLGTMNSDETGEAYRWDDCVTAKDPANPGE